MKGIGTIFSELRGVWSTKHWSISQRTSLMLGILKMRTLRFLAGRSLINQPSCIYILGFKIHFYDFNDFFWSFKDIFVDDVYFFQSENNKPVIIDCGGNIGISVIYFKLIYPTSKITVFEPDPSNCQYLEKNIMVNGLNDSVQLIRLAVSDKEGTIAFYGAGRAVTMFKDLNQKEVSSGRNYHAEDMVTVDCVKLSDHLTYDLVDCLKLDIEGAEGAVVSELHNAGKLNNVSNLIIEFHKFDVDSPRVGDIVNNLEETGFVVQCYYGDLTMDAMLVLDHYHYMVKAKR